MVWHGCTSACVIAHIKIPLVEHPHPAKSRCISGSKWKRLIDVTIVDFSGVRCPKSAATSISTRECNSAPRAMTGQAGMVRASDAATVQIMRADFVVAGGWSGAPMSPKPAPHSVSSHQAPTSPLGTSRRDPARQLDRTRDATGRRDYWLASRRAAATAEGWPARLSVMNSETRTKVSRRQDHRPRQLEMVAES